MGGFRGENNDFKTKIKTAGLQKPTVYYVAGLRKRFFAGFTYDPELSHSFLFGK